ncbi:DNA-binding transcriptional LysR family regulator [Rhodoblastus acidophilus]|uniref:LysR family transcriptional regulator n=1 Tax=Rhodoblastus acidophilus TaxID=1074 RepID=UPI002225A7E4|nr:LysR family transcriptional regulator [Rhodoblastus acidophilus]MCW2319000.1 DNA-binding transcriptional LysR family regulator [Rhodoblastus acidophilus]
MDHLNDMALFVEVVKAKSFRQAADVLDMPNSTLSRRIATLEQAIGLRLLNRTTRRVELTEAGQLYFDRCKRIVEEARIAHEQLAEMVARPTGLLRVSLPVDFATTYLAPLLPEFAARYPGISVELDLTPRNVDLVAEPFDLAIRAGSVSQPNLIVQVIARVSAALFAGAGYLARYGEPKHPDELAQHECLAMRAADTWTVSAGETRVEAKLGGRFRMNSVAMMRRLAALDMGIVMLPERIVADDLASRKLRRILPAWKGPQTPFYAVTETRLLPAKTQRFIEFLRDRLREE